MITIQEVLTDVARIVAGVEDVTGAFYPANDAAPISPEAVIFWGSDDTEIEYELGSELWVAPFVIRILVAHQQNQSPAEMGKIDLILQRIQDLFSPVDGTRPGDLLQVSGYVSTLRVERIKPGLTTEKGGVPCYAGDAHMRLVFRRVR